MKNFQPIKLDKRAFRFPVSPVSVFDQQLEEDYNVNRLEDSITLWTSICSSKLLAKTQLILFLNKCDLLRRKLKRGIKVNKYLPNFGDRPNEVMPVVKCKSIQNFDEQLTWWSNVLVLDFRGMFRDILKQFSPEGRSVYIYPTTVTVIFSYLFHDLLLSLLLCERIPQQQLLHLTPFAMVCYGKTLGPRSSFEHLFF